VIVINKGLIFGGLVFATHRDRGLYIGTSLRDRPQWLKAHPEAWRTIEDEEREAARSVQHQTSGGLSRIGADFGTGADAQTDGNDSAKADDVRPEPVSPSDQLSLPEAPSPAIAPSVASNIRDEVTIEGRRYISVEQLASTLGVSLRTLSRWCKERGSPSRIKVGSKLFFEADEIPQWRSRQQMAPPGIAIKKRLVTDARNKDLTKS
jgi:predicted DNA-binding transcriptional regulator AlpA